MKTKIKSFDVFDTLIARRFINNDQILENIEQTLRIPNFVKFRKLADTGKRSIVDIYNFLVQSRVLTQTVADAAMELEYSLEILHTFPIAENIKKVNHGDLLISDMYLSAPMILEMVRNAGLDKQVTIYPRARKDRWTNTRSL
jgi:predicted HAD superfamily hydrolase